LAKPPETRSWCSFEAASLEVAAVASGKVHAYVVCGIHDKDRDANDTLRKKTGATRLGLKGSVNNELDGLPAS